MGRKLRTQELKVNCDVKYYYYYQYCLICFGVIIINIVQYALVRYLRPTLYFGTSTVNRVSTKANQNFQTTSSADCLTLQNPNLEK